jgi:hypothetical protein
MSGRMPSPEEVTFLRSREQRERIAGNRNVLFAHGIKAAKRYYKRLAEDPEFAKKVVALAG